MLGLLFLLPRYFTVRFSISPLLCRLAINRGTATLCIPGILAYIDRPVCHRSEMPAFLSEGRISTKYLGSDGYSNMFSACHSCGESLITHQYVRQLVYIRMQILTRSLYSRINYIINMQYFLHTMKQAQEPLNVGKRTIVQHGRSSYCVIPPIWIRHHGLDQNKSRVHVQIVGNSVVIQPLKEEAREYWSTHSWAITARSKSGTRNSLRSTDR